MANPAAHTEVQTVITGPVFSTACTYAMLLKALRGEHRHAPKNPGLLAVLEKYLGAAESALPEAASGGDVATPLAAKLLGAVTSQGDGAALQGLIEDLLCCCLSLPSVEGRDYPRRAPVAAVSLQENASLDTPTKRQAAPLVDQLGEVPRRAVTPPWQGFTAVMEAFAQQHAESPNGQSFSGPTTPPPMSPVALSTHHHHSLLRLSDSVASIARTLRHVRTEVAQLTAEDFDGTWELNQYVVLQTIGTGAQGEVYLAMDTALNELRAIKQVKRLRGAVTPAAEVEAMKRCRHRNIVTLYEVIDDPRSSTVYLVMQYVEHGPLSAMNPNGTCSTIRPRMLADYARQLCAGLCYLHRHGVYHRDIKPDNILRGSDDTVYLADFGVSEVFETQTAAHGVTGTKGTSAFLAPELILQYETAADSDQRPSKVDGGKVDVWALGVSLYTMLHGRLPWHRERCSVREYWELVLNEPIDLSQTPPPDDEDDSPGAAAAWRQFLGAMLQKDASRRCSAEEGRLLAKSLEAAYAAQWPSHTSNTTAHMPPPPDEVPSGPRYRRHTLSSAEAELAREQLQAADAMQGSPHATGSDASLTT